MSSAGMAKTMTGDRFLQAGFLPVAGDQMAQVGVVKAITVFGDEQQVLD
jgi:hypothetical protein